MLKTCIYTLEPVAYGGVPDKLQFAHDLLRGLGHEPRLIYTANNRVPPGSRLAKLNYLWRARPADEVIFGMQGFALPDYPLPPWLTYFMPLVFARHIINTCSLHLAVSGSNHVALPSAWLKQPFIVWIGTLYDEEIVGKARGGDAWAVSLLRQRVTRMLLAWLEKFVFRRASLILTNGEHTAQAVRGVCPEAAHKVRVLIFPVDETRFRPAPDARRQAPFPYLLFAARINEPRKNTGLLVRAFAEVRQHHPQMRLVLTGDPPNPDLLAAAADANLSDGVDFLGFQTTEQLIRLYQGAELFVVPSLQEGMCNAMLEALACGTPVISTRCGGPEKVIRDGETGYLVDNNDAAALARAILAALADTVKLEAMRAQARAYAVRTYARPIAEGILKQALADVYPQHHSRVAPDSAP